VGEVGGVVGDGLRFVVLSFFVCKQTFVELRQTVNAVRTSEAR
jgi:hypothetical protein